MTIQMLPERRDTVLEIARRHGVTSVRVFGSIARGDESAESDATYLRHSSQSDAAITERLDRIYGEDESGELDPALDAMQPIEAERLHALVAQHRGLSVPG